MESEADAFARLAHELHDQTNLEQTLASIVESAVAVVGCDYAGVLLTRKGNQFDAITASHPIAEKADKLQIELHEGPGIVAVADARTTLVTDTATDTRWPRWAAGMRDLHLGSVLAVPLWTSKSTLGALNLYAGSPRWFDHRCARRCRSLRSPCLNRAIQCETRGVIVAGHRRPHTYRPGPRHPYGTVCS